MNIEDCRRKVVIPKGSEEYIIRQKIYLKEYVRRPEVKKRVCEYIKNKRRKDPAFCKCMDLRNRLYQILTKYTKTGKVSPSKSYGIDFIEIIKYLEPFPENISEYHIDHIIPLSLFDFNNAEHIRIAFAPENHQWLTIKENLEKGNKLIMPHKILIKYKNGGKKYGNK